MSIQDRVSPEEWKARVNLAACYRLVDYYGMSDMTGTHITVRVPGTHDEFLINDSNLFFEECTASSLIKIDIKGNVLDGSNGLVNKAGYVIHSAIHEARHDVDCVLHTHTVPGMAVSALECGLLPLFQHSFDFYLKTSYHDYEGVAVNEDEKQRLVADLGENYALILRNHGLLTCGRNVAEAFSLMFRMNKACEAQLYALSTREEIHEVAPKVRVETSNFMKGRNTFVHDRSWAGHLRRLDRIDPTYKH
ncbi:MAG: class II aldolase/adducin family protein [Rhodospirillales bacterium]